MADTYTANYGFTKPEPGQPGWDGKLNADIDAIDDEIKNREDEAAALNADKAARPSSSTANNLAALDSNGDLIDSGRKISDVNTLTSDFYAYEAVTPDMIVTLRAGKLMFAGTLVIQPQQSVAITAADTTQNRIDRVVIDEQTGVASVETGTLEITPVAPAIPAGKLPICQVQVDAGTSAITNSMIADERVLIRDHGNDVTGYLRGNVQYVEETVGAHATSYNVGALATDAWATIDSSAWTVLSVLPAGTKWIEVNFDISTGDNSSNAPNAYVYARKNGDTTAVGRQTLKAVVNPSSGSAINSHIFVAGVKIPVDSSGRFELYTSEITAMSCTMSLVGFGL